jgi:hypothetical protein
VSDPSPSTHSTTSPSRQPAFYTSSDVLPSPGPNGDVPRHRRGRLATVAVLIVSLVAAMLTRTAATRFQEKSSPNLRRTTGGGASLAGMDSYALALLLGGLRGPLVMVLWAQSESQKADRDLEGIDTQIEWIRRLQPEFDTVHIFQMWNKAYNLSVQMVGLANKYTTILDAVDYGKSIDAERPDNLNILKELGRIYSDKLGGANPEKHYYRERLRRETRHREEQAGTARRGEPGFQRLSHDVMLDSNGDILPQYLKPRRSEVSAEGETYDGSDLQFLKQYEPFPYGLSPFALGYNYNKRAQVLMSTLKQKPIQLSESVADSQPGLNLKGWSEEEWERARRMEIKALGIKLPADRIPQETPTAALAIDAKPADASLLPEIIYSLNSASRLAGDAIKEYERHLRNPEFASKVTMYASHMDHLLGIRDLTAGDRDYLKAMQSTDAAERDKLLASASGHYRESIRHNGLTALRYFTSDSLAAAVLPPGISRANIGTGPLGSRTAVTWEDVYGLMNAIRAEINRRGGADMADENAEDRMEYETYVNRAVERLKQIDLATKR